MAWSNDYQLEPKKFYCGFCNSVVAGDRGFYDKGNMNRAYVCPNCDRLNYFDIVLGQTPGVVPGNAVSSLPEQLEVIYNEARRCVSVKAFTASVLACRKLLMHIAVEQGASTGGSFLSYVEYLAAKGFVPPNGACWVDHIRKKGNEATHEIVLMTESDAEELISFSEMLLKFIYEFPAKVPKGSDGQGR